MEIIKLLLIIVFAIFGGITGAILLGLFGSWPLAIAGGVVGMLIGALFGKLIPILEWFT